jgi:hypothetical protein
MLFTHTHSHTHTHTHTHTHARAHTHTYGSHGPRVEARAGGADAGAEGARTTSCVGALGADGHKGGAGTK